MALGQDKPGGLREAIPLSASEVLDVCNKGLRQTHP